MARVSGAPTRRSRRSPVPVLGVAAVILSVAGVILGVASEPHGVLLHKGDGAAPWGQYFSPGFGGYYTMDDFRPEPVVHVVQPALPVSYETFEDEHQQVLQGPDYGQSHLGPDYSQSHQGPDYGQSHQGPDYAQGHLSPDDGQTHEGPDYGQVWKAPALALAHQHTT
ncbi:Coagulation factor V [Frankliniella fusca]|uniref:Coagulation factor V n=1 Tax=Frankliniella fusca TaxID=407009 RepID=A0AAE1I3C4_9NEOP|nr:Coagulation factor V [Frankliniella fusca]